MVRGWKNKQQISTRSANESPWPLSNPINIHAAWVGLWLELGFHQFRRHEHIMHPDASERLTDLLTFPWISILLHFDSWKSKSLYSSCCCLLEKHNVNDLPQQKPGQINQSAAGQNINISSPKAEPRWIHSSTTPTWRALIQKHYVWTNV